jgi:hypothetical protein
MPSSRTIPATGGSGQRVRHILGARDDRGERVISIEVARDAAEATCPALDAPFAGHDRRQPVDTARRMHGYEPKHSSRKR